MTPHAVRSTFSKIRTSSPTVSKPDLLMANMVSLADIAVDLVAHRFLAVSFMQVCILGASLLSGANAWHRQSQLWRWCWWRYCRFRRLSFDWSRKQHDVTSALFAVRSVPRKWHIDQVGPSLFFRNTSHSGQLVLWPTYLFCLSFGLLVDVTDQPSPISDMSLVFLRLSFSGWA